MACYLNSEESESKEMRNWKIEDGQWEWMCKREPFEVQGKRWTDPRQRLIGLCNIFSSFQAPDDLRRRAYLFPQKGQQEAQRQD